MSTDDSITVDDDGTVTRVRLSGEIDAMVRNQAAEAVERVVDGRLPVVLDLGRVRFLDSTGVTFLLRLREVSVRAGLTCELEDVPDRVATVLAVLGLADVLPVRAGVPQPIA